MRLAILRISRGNGWSEVLSIKNRRNDLINFLTDGYLPTEATDKFTGREYSQMRMKAYENQLNIATYGVQIINLLKAEGVKLQQNTKNSIYELLEKYKSEGGKKDFSELNKMIK